MTNLSIANSAIIEPLLNATSCFEPWLEQLFEGCGLVPAGALQRIASVDLNSFGRVLKWISRSVTPPPGLVPAG